MTQGDWLKELQVKHITWNKSFQEKIDAESIEDVSSEEGELFSDLHDTM